MRALVVDDERSAREYLAELLTDAGVTVMTKAASLGEAEAALDQQAIDVAFVDIRLEGAPRPGDAGLRLVREFAARPRAPLFVLATAFTEHALVGFDLGVADYLLKPFAEARVARCVASLRSRLRAATDVAPIVARRGGSLVLLRHHEIWAFEAVDRLSFVHSTVGRMDLDLSLTAIERALPQAFMRVHRNWLVNQAFVRSIDRAGGEASLWVGAGLDAGVAVPIARERTRAVKELLLGAAHGVRRS